MRKSLTAIVVAIALLSLIPLGTVNAQDLTIYEYGYSNINAAGQMNMLHPTSNTEISAHYSTVQPSIAGYLESVTVWLATGGYPDGKIAMQIEGTGNSLNAAPNGTVLASSINMIDCRTELSNASITLCTFLFAGTYYMETTQAYAIVIYVAVDVTMSETDHVHVYYDNDGGAAGYGNCYISSAWGSPQAAYDIACIVTGSTLPSDYETTDWSTEDTADLIENAMEFLVPLVVMLLPAVLFIIFFKRTDKWLILIGLAIGTGLGYYFGMIPVWLVFLVAIGLIGLAYSEVRRNG